MCVPQHPFTCSKHSLPTRAINSFSLSFCWGVSSLLDGVMARCLEEGRSKTRERGRAMAMVALLSLASRAASHATRRRRRRSTGLGCVRRALGRCLSALIVAVSVPRDQRLPSKSWAAPHTPHGEARCQRPGSRFTGRFLPRFGPIDLSSEGRAQKSSLGHPSLAVSSFDCRAAHTEPRQPKQHQ